MEYQLELPPTKSPARQLVAVAKLLIAADLEIIEKALDRFIEYLCSRSRLVQIYFRWRPVLRDPDDDRILELAVRAQCPLVTFNARDFAEAGRFGVRVIAPKDAIALIGGPR